MPGLIRGVARTAVVAGTATAVSNNVSRRQATKWNAREQESAANAYNQQQYAQAQQAPPPGYAQPPAYAPPPQAPAGGGTDLVAELGKLAELRSAGVLTDAEFEAAKAKVLAS